MDLWPKIAIFVYFPLELQLLLFYIRNLKKWLQPLKIYSKLFIIIIIQGGL